jgi:hypothetical protein
MRRATILVPALALGLALGTAARADEIIKFNNGTYLTIKSHDLFEGMVRVQLASESSMSFPLSMVESIEKGGVTLFRPAVKANIVAGKAGAGTVSLDDAPPTQPDYRVYATPPPPPRKMSNSLRRASQMTDDPVDLLFMGGEDGTPQGISMFPGHEDPQHQRFGVTGNKSLGSGFEPTPQAGDTVTIQSEQQAPRTPTRMQQRMTPLPTHPAEKLALRQGEGDSAPEKGP